MPSNHPKPNSFRTALNRLRRLDRTTRLKLIIFGTLILGLVLYLALDIIFNGPLTRFLSNRDQVVLAVQSFGFFAPLIYVILQIVQTVAAPIPGQVVGSVGGFLFGPWGILWTLIGSLIGDYIVFRLARRFGRLTSYDLKKMGCVMKRAQYFITCGELEAKGVNELHPEGVRSLILQPKRRKKGEELQLTLPFKEEPV